MRLEMGRKKIKGNTVILRNFKNMKEGSWKNMQMIIVIKMPQIFMTVMKLIGFQF